MRTRNYFGLFSVLILILLLISAGCAKSGNPARNNPVQSGMSGISHEYGIGRCLWGLWECRMDPGENEILVEPMRAASFTANVNNLLASTPGSFKINITDVSEFLTQGKLACNITIKHPLAGLDRFAGFDVWGVFLHNGASALQYDGLTYGNGPMAGENEAIVLNPDGYTRWFNQPEFDGDGPPLFEYWPGSPSTLASPTATLNGYKIFADSLNPDFDYYDWITATGYANNRGIFRAGAINTRRYDLQFPMVGGAPEVKFQFAVMATWEEGNPVLTGDPTMYEPSDFPPNANVDEAFFVHTSTVESTLFNDGTGDPGGSGGHFTADVEVFDWQGGTVGGNGVVNEVERIIIEAGFIPGGGSHEIAHPELEAIASEGTANSSVFRVEILDCAPPSEESAEFWVVVESAGENGDSYDQGFPSEYPDGTRRASFVRGSVSIADEWPFENNPPVIDLIEDDLVGPGFYKNPVYKSDPPVNYNVIFYDPDPGQTQTVTWWITGDGIAPGPADIVTMPVDWSTREIGEYDIWVEVDDSYDATLAGPFDITLEKGEVKEWGDPISIDSQSEMPRAVENAAGEIVLVYHKDSSGVYYAVNNGVWSTPETAYYWKEGMDEVAPTWLQIVSGDSGHTTYASYVGWGPDENIVNNMARNALRWNGDPGTWEYTWLWDYTEREDLFLPDDDGSFVDLYTFTDTGEPGPSLRGSDRAYWGQEDHDPGYLTWLDGYSCEISSCNAAVRDSAFHYIAYRREVAGISSARVARISKTNSLDHEEFTIYQGASGETVDSVALSIDDSGNLHAAWLIYGPDDQYRIHYSKSTDWGETWSPSVMAFDGGAYGSILPNYVGVVTDSFNRPYITYCNDLYIYMVTSSNGVDWDTPSSPYTGPLPLGWHQTQAYPVMTSGDSLNVFYIAKNEQWQFGGLYVVGYD